MNNDTESQSNKGGFLLKIRQRSKNRHHTISFIKKIIENALLMLKLLMLGFR